jgi:pimeloyl-ACP methyl ester carboxylesterase
MKIRANRIDVEVEDTAEINPQDTDAYTRPAVLRVLLSRSASPTLVLQDKAAPLVPFAHGEDVAQRITGARLVGIDGMGHDLPSEPVSYILDTLIPHLRAVKP